MSSRAATILGGLFLALVVVQAAILIRQQRDRHLGTLECRAANAGVPLASKDGRVYVHPSGRPEEVVTTGALNEGLRVPAGRYDVRVLFLRSQDQQSRWLPGVSLAAGARTVREVEFAAGELSVDAAVGGGAERGQVVVYVFAPEDHNRVITSMGTGERVLIAAGSYDLRVVWAVDSREKDVQWLRDVRVAGGVHARREMAFQRGVLRLRARNAGKDLPPGAVTVDIHRAGDAQEELLDSALAGMPLGLAVGRYDIKATFQASSDRPSRSLRGLEIANGQTREETIDFSSGTLVVRAALKDGTLLGKYDAYVYYYRPGDHQEAIAYAPAGETVVLEGARYDIRASFFRSHDRPDIWVRDLVVRPGQTHTQTVTFTSGRLLVRAYDRSGAELVGDNIFLYLYPTGSRTRPVAVARSGEMLVVSEGVYDIRAEDTRRPNVSVWLTDVPLVAGARSERSVTFPGGNVSRGAGATR